jgi:hypothetical protein
MLIITLKQNIEKSATDKDSHTCQTSYAGLRINIGVLMPFETSRGKKHWQAHD